MSEDNLIQLRKPNVKRLGITLSFLLEAETKDTINAQVYLEQLGERIAALTRTEFPSVKHTLTSRQEYEP